MRHWASKSPLTSANRFPFPTALLAEHLTSPGSATATAVYAGQFSSRTFDSFERAHRLLPTIDELKAIRPTPVAGA
jgi:hypothetical protein